MMCLKAFYKKYHCNLLLRTVQIKLFHLPMLNIVRKVLFQAVIKLQPYL